MTVLHVCNVQNVMSNGATVAVVSHVNAQARLGTDDIRVLYLRGEALPWDEHVTVTATPQEAGVMVTDAPHGKRAAVTEVSHGKRAAVGYEGLPAPDIVVFHELYHMEYFWLAKKLRRAWIPYIVIPHGSLTKVAQAQKRFAKQAVNLVFAKRFLRHAVAVQFLSEQEREVSMLMDTVTFTSPNGVYLPKVKKEYLPAHEAVSGETPEFRLLFIGRLNMFYKGLDVLMEACGAIREEMRRNHITLHLHGPQDEDYAKIAAMISEYGMEDIVKLGGSVFGAEKERTLLAADVFIQPSRSEGQPMGILEAFAIGLPVILTPETSYEEAVTQYHCGFLTECKREAVAEAILHAFREREHLEEYSRNARAYAAEHFAWPKVAARALKMYKFLRKRWKREKLPSS